MQHRLPAPFALVAECMQPLHRALVVDGMPPVDVNVDELMGDLAKEFQNRENIEPWIAGANKEFAIFSVPRMLSARSCAILREIVDRGRSPRPDSVDAAPDHQHPIEDHHQLMDLIGTMEGQRLIALPREFRSREAQFKRQRCEAADATRTDEEACELEDLVYSLEEAFVRRYTSETRPFNPFHRDKYDITVNVALCADADHEGGRLLGVYNGRVHAVQRDEGEATVHDSELVHAVSAMRTGTRYSLILFFSSRPRPRQVR